MVAVLFAAGTAKACSFHKTTFGGFQSAYPGSLATAVAVAKAKASGQLPAIEIRSDILGYWQVTRLLERLGAGLKGTPEGAPEFSLLLVEQKLWTVFSHRLSGNASAYKANVHAASPSPDATVIVTAFPVLYALLDGGMSPIEAIDAQLMMVAGKDREEVLTVLSYFDFFATDSN